MSLECLTGAELPTEYLFTLHGQEASCGGFGQSLCLQPMESVQNSPFCAFPRAGVLCSVTHLMSFCLSLRLQLKCRIAATWVPFWPDRPLGSEPTWPHLHTVHRAQSTAHHNLVAQVSVVPLLCPTSAWAPAPNAVCTCPETASRGGE